MENFDVVGVGALNKDIKIKVTPEEFELINEELDKPFVLDKEDFDIPEKFEPTIEVITKVTKQDKKNLKIELGGSATNTMVALSRMGFHTGCFGLVGSYDNFLQKKMREEGIDPMVFIGDLESGACISISDGKDRALRVYPNSNDLFGYRHINGPYLGNLSLYKIVHMTSFACLEKSEPFYAQIKIAEELGKDVKISFSPDEFYTELGLKMLKPILKNSHVVFLSRRNMKILTGEDYIEGSKKVLEYGPKFVVTTLGEEGSHIRYSDIEFLAVASPITEIVSEELTGAGDYFAAGFLAGLLKRKLPGECMYLGNKIAGMKLEGAEREAYRRFIL